MMVETSDAQLERIKLVVRRSYSLSTAPATVVQLIAAIDRGDASAADLERIIVSDGILAADMMRLGPALGWSDLHSEASLRMLIMRMGFRTMRSLAVSLLAKHLVGNQSAPHFDALQYRRMCYATAALARYFHARNSRRSDASTPWSADELFAVGLISHLGSALLATHAPEIFERCCFYGKRRNLSIASAYEAIFSSSLYELASIVLENWNLPEIFRTTVPYMDAPWRAEPMLEAITCLHSAQLLAHRFGYRLEDWDCEKSVPVDLVCDIEISDAEATILREHIDAAVASMFGQPKAA